MSPHAKHPAQGDTRHKFSDRTACHTLPPLTVPSSILLLWWTAFRDELSVYPP